MSQLHGNSVLAEKTTFVNCTFVFTNFDYQKMRSA